MKKSPIYFALIMRAIVFTVLSVFTFQLYGQRVAFQNVHVIPLTSEDVIIENQTVLVVGQNIRSISPHQETEIPKGFKVINGEGLKYLMPGMMDSHSHLPITQGLPMPMDDYLFLQLANGVTSLRCCRYEETAMALRDSLLENEVLAPRLYLSSPMLWATHQVGITFDYSKASTEIPRFKQEGYDFMKLINGLNPYTHKSILEACKESNLPLVGHLPRSVGLDYAISSGQNDIEHFQGYADMIGNEESKLDSFIQETANHNIYNCPTIFWYDANAPFLEKEYLGNIEGLEYIHPDLRATWEENYDKYRDVFLREQPDAINKRKKVLEKFASSNARLLLSHGDGDYCVPGYGMLEEAKIWQAAGIDNYRILESACKNPALFFSQEDQWGTVEVDKYADLILLDKNPLDDIENIRGIEGVMLLGKWLSKDDIAQGLKQIEASHTK